jgi:RNase P subunit RPR2
MFCKNCGNKLADDCKFCPSCGTKVSLSEVSQQVEEEEEDPVVWIKCKSCGEKYYVENQDDWQENDLSYGCSNCHESIDVAFFGYCYQCNDYVGFKPYELSNLLIGFAKGAIKGWLNPLAGMKELGQLAERFVDSIPNAVASGECPFCKQSHIKCPQCGFSVKYNNSDDSSNPIIACSNCGTRMRHP